MEEERGCLTIKNIRKQTKIRLRREVIGTICMIDIDQMVCEYYFTDATDLIQRVHRIRLIQ